MKAILCILAIIAAIAAFQYLRPPSAKEIGEGVASVQEQHDLDREAIRLNREAKDMEASDRYMRERDDKERKELGDDGYIAKYGAEYFLHTFGTPPPVPVAARFSGTPYPRSITPSPEQIAAQQAQDARRKADEVARRYGSQ